MSEPESTTASLNLSALTLTPEPPLQTFPLGDFTLQSGTILPSAQISYTIHGSPSLPPILYPTWFSGLTSSNTWLLGASRPLSPEKYCIIIPALFGNSQSTSPSNSDLRPFPAITMYDNVRAQHELLTKGLGITHLRAVLGWSMGAAQAYQWATQYPEFMDIIVPFCGAARCATHNKVFLEGQKSALLATKGVRSAGAGSDGGERGEWSKDEWEVGMRAFGRGYAGWGFSQTFYRERVFETHLGYKDLEDFLVGFWEKWAVSKDPENMLTMLRTWQTADVSQQEPYHGDFKAAMQAIKAKTLVLPSKTDLYFPPEDSEIEVSLMREGVATLAVFPSIWGHWAGGPGESKEDGEWLDEQLRGVGL
ncbi:hypothetical protein VC83_08125 [Pseudogymnoascus destructans]|nr:uncharacterized protein VC83_08125 [Pseudogymnoascus destructans]OAF55318.1 hypothetical protein VC83_08125 [Pseudogymnoascus destructans]